MNPALAKWLADRGVNLMIYGVIILAVGFALYSAFLKPTSSVKVGSGGTYNEAPQGLQPSFGCASGSQFLGWAHHADKHKGAK